MTDIIIVGVDSSETARRAAETALELATALGATLHVVTAFENDRTEKLGGGNQPSGREAEAVAQEIASILRADGGPDIEAFAVLGSPADALIKQAESYGACMIVVGNRRMQGMGRILGSVANHVAHHAPCDVVIAKTVNA